MCNSLNDSKPVNILSGRPLDRSLYDILNISRFFSEDMLQHNKYEIVTKYTPAKMSVYFCINNSLNDNTDKNI